MLLEQRKIPIVLVSRCFNGIAQDVYGYEGGGKQLKEMGVIFSNGLNGPKARIKLLVALQVTTIMMSCSNYLIISKTTHRSLCVVFVDNMRSN